MHNFALAALSSFLLAAIVHELSHHVALHLRSGPLQAAWVMFCDPSPHKIRTGRLLFWYYLNYITKYLELSDTVLLCLRGKPLPFLHVYHHAATLVLCWTQLAAKSSVQWIPIVLNLMVHVPMYYYYGVRRAACSVRAGCAACMRDAATRPAWHRSRRWAAARGGRSTSPRRRLCSFAWMCPRRPSPPGSRRACCCSMPSRRVHSCPLTSRRCSSR